MNSQAYRDWYGTWDSADVASARTSMRESIGYYAPARPCPECGFPEVFVIAGRESCAGCGYEREDLRPCGCVIETHRCAACDAAALRTYSK